MDPGGFCSARDASFGVQDLKTRSTQRRVLRRLRGPMPACKNLQHDYRDRIGHNRPLQRHVCYCPLYSTLSMSALTYSVIYCLAFNVRRRRETPHAPTVAREKLNGYIGLWPAHHRVLMITTFMSIPNYAGDDKERNLKHALLTFSADIAALSQCVACCFGVFEYRRSMKDPTWVLRLPTATKTGIGSKLARTKAFSAQTRVSRFTITLPA